MKILRFYDLSEGQYKKSAHITERAPVCVHVANDNDTIVDYYRRIGVDLVKRAHSIYTYETCYDTFTNTMFTRYVVESNHIVIPEYHVI